MNLRLGASFHTGNIVTHWVDAGLGWVDLDNQLQLLFTTFKLFLPERALRLALFDHQRFGIFAFL